MKDCGILRATIAKGIKNLKFEHLTGKAVCFDFNHEMPVGRIDKIWEEGEYIVAEITITNPNIPYAMKTGYVGVYPSIIVKKEHIEDNVRIIDEAEMLELSFGFKWFYEWL